MSTARARIGGVCGMLAACMLLAACGGPTTAPAPEPPLPAHSLPGHPTAARPITADTLASEALDTGAALAVLDDTGFLAGSARSFAAPAQGVRTVQARILRFSSEDGATRYVRWLQMHVTAIIGDGRVAESARLPSPGFVFVHEPGGCCPKEQPVALGVWRRGSTVLWVEAIGAVNAEDAVRFAGAFDTAIRTI